VYTPGVPPGSTRPLRAGAGTPAGPGGEARNAAVGLGWGSPVPREVDRTLREDARVRALCAALAAAAADEELLLRFLWDLLSPRELVNAANRWAAARLLLAGQTQAATARTLGLSAKTVIEVDRFTRGVLGAGGFGEVERHLGGRTAGPEARSGAGRAAGRRRWPTT
jgi:uncharacterized protein YerC